VKQNQKWKFFIFSSKPNQKFQKVFLANQKFEKKKKKNFSSSSFLFLFLLHPKAIHPNNSPLYQNINFGYLIQINSSRTRKSHKILGFTRKSALKKIDLIFDEGKIQSFSFDV